MKLQSLTWFLFALLILRCSTETEEVDYLPYYHLINAADYARFQRLPIKADSLYQAAFKLVRRPFYMDCLHAAENAVLISEKEVYAYLKKGMAWGLRLEMVEENKSFDSFRQTIYWSKLTQSYPRQRKKYEASINQELGKELQCMLDIDQLVRTKPEEVEQSMREVDDKNLDGLLTIIAEYGYPGYSLVGEEIGRAFPILFHHFQPYENEQYFYDLLNTAMQTGELSPFRNAAFRDYDCLKKGEKIQYGIYHRDYLGEKTIYPIANKKQVNTRRHQMGLPTLEQYMEIRDLKYNPESDTLFQPEGF